MDSSVSGKDEMWFLRVCHHVPHELYDSKHCISKHCFLRKQRWGIESLITPSYILRFDLSTTENRELSDVCNHVDQLKVPERYNGRFIVVDRMYTVRLFDD